MNIPDRLCTEKKSPFFNKSVLDRKPRVFVNGVEHVGTVVEYCISGGWARVTEKDEGGNYKKNMLKTGILIRRIHGEIKVEYT